MFHIAIGTSKDEDTIRMTPINVAQYKNKSTYHNAQTKVKTAEIKTLF